MKNKVISLSLIILLSILVTGCKKDITLISEGHAGKTLVTFDGSKITSGDIDNFKKSRQDNITDKQALEMMIEKELLYKEAQSQGLTATLKEAKEESNRQKNMYKQYATEEQKKELQDILKELNITEKEYWNDYSPKAFRKSITIARMKKSVEGKIHTDILKNHSDWGQAEIKKGLEESYSNAINDLKPKFNLKNSEMR